MSKHNRDRRERRREHRRAVGAVVLGPGAELPSVRAFLAATAGCSRAGEIRAILCVHEDGCPFPENYRECTCANGPELRVAGEDPEAN